MKQNQSSLCGGIKMVKREVLNQLIEEVAEYISELEDKYGLTSEEIVEILETVKEQYEWED
jgi:lipoate-protein ligase A